MASGQGLESLGLSALARRATEAGVPAAELEGALDGDAPRLQLHRLVLEHASRNTVGGEKPNLAPSPEAEALRIELSTLRLGQLQKRAVVEGVGSGELEEATDSDAPTKSITELIVALHQSRVERTATAAAAAAEEHGRKVAALEAELNKLKLSALQKRAASEGVSEDRMSGALDSDSPKKELVALLVAVCLPPIGMGAAVADAPHTQADRAAIAVQSSAVGGMKTSLTSAESTDNAARRTHQIALESLKLMELYAHATEAGVQDGVLEAIMEGDDIVHNLVTVLMQRYDDSAAAEAQAPTRNETLHQELSSLRLLGLLERAQREGIDEGKLEAAMKGGDKKGGVIDLLLEQATAATLRQAVPVASKDRPHFGTPAAAAPAPSPHRGNISEISSKIIEPQPEESFFDRSATALTKHVMLSYNWDDQETVKRVYDQLSQLGLRCWMDIYGGMDTDIYDSMADGVSNASVMVCFMSQKYQESENCALEVKFARQSGVEIVPVMMQRGWKASGWLGLLTAGSLWTPLFEDGAFEENVGQLHGQIQKVLVDNADDEMMSASSGIETVRAELERLRKATETKSGESSSSHARMKWPAISLFRDRLLTHALTRIRHAICRGKGPAQLRS